MMTPSHERGQGLTTAQGRPFREFLRSVISNLRQQIAQGKSQNAPAIQSAPNIGQAPPQGQATPAQASPQSGQAGLINYKFNVRLGSLFSDKELEELFPGLKNSFRDR